MIIIIGGRGHASSIRSALRANNVQKIDFIDAYPTESLASRIDDYMKKAPAEGLIVGLGAINKRVLVIKSLNKIEIEYSNVIHPSAFVDQTARIGKGVFIGSGVYIGPNTSIEDHSIINTGSIIEHDCQVGRLSHIGPNSTCCGYSKVGCECMVGASSTILPNIELENYCTLGAGAVLSSSFKANRLTLVGIPAKPI